MSVPKVAAVVGAGTMGPGMAAVLARAGSEVRLYDISDEVLERAKGTYQMAAGALDRVEAASAPGGSVSFEPDLGKATAGAELVLEANLCFADPHSDPASFLMAAGATLGCQRDGQVRRIPAAGFLAGPYQIVLAPGELLAAVELPARPDRTGLSHLRMKLTERPVVTVTALITLRGNAVAQARLVVGSVGSLPFAAEVAALTGASPADFARRAEACAEQAAADVTPLPDGEASPDYLRHMVAVHARQALGAAFAAA